MASTTPDRQSTVMASNGCPRIDESVLSAIGADPAPITVAQFQRWFACFASAGEEQ